MAVVSLNGTAVPGTREADEEIVERLRELLDEAAAGRLHGLAYVAVVDDRVTVDWLGKASCHYMLAGASRLHHKMDAANEAAADQC